jgi:glycosyltransferase involved in cell wall biosynthesis
MSCKVLYIIPNLRKGGAERMVIDLVRELSSRAGFEVALVILHNDIEYLVEEIRPLIQHIPASIAISIWKKNTYKLDSLQKFVEQFKPDIIHSQLFEAEIISRSISYPQAKWFTLCQDNMYQFENFHLSTLLSKRKLISFYEKNYLFKQYKKNGGTHFVAISNHTKEYFERTAPQYPTALLFNTIDYRRFFKMKTQLRSSTLKMVNVGSFVDKKNQQLLIEMAHILDTRKVPFELHLLGDGPNRERIQQQINSYSLNDNVMLHGNVHNVEDYLWKSDMYVHSATYEPFGLVLVEAMAAGLPVVTMDGKGNRDLIEEGKNGYMIFEDDPERFADTVMRLYNDPEKYKKISAYAQQYAEQFDIRKYMDSLIRLYKNAMAH